MHNGHRYMEDGLLLIMKNVSIPGSTPGSVSYRSIKTGVKTDVVGLLLAFVRD